MKGYELRRTLIASYGVAVLLAVLGIWAGGLVLAAPGDAVLPSFSPPYKAVITGGAIAVIVMGRCLIGTAGGLCKDRLILALFGATGMTHALWCLAFLRFGLPAVAFVLLMLSALCAGAIVRLGRVRGLTNTVYALPYFAYTLYLLSFNYSFVMLN